MEHQLLPWFQSNYIMKKNFSLNNLTVDEKLIYISKNKPIISKKDKIKLLTDKSVSVCLRAAEKLVGKSRELQELVLNNTFSEVRLFGVVNGFAKTKKQQDKVLQDVYSDIVVLGIKKGFVKTIAQKRKILHHQDVLVISEGIKAGFATKKDFYRLRIYNRYIITKELIRQNLVPDSEILDLFFHRDKYIQIEMLASNYSLPTISMEKFLLSASDDVLELAIEKKILTSSEIYFLIYASPEAISTQIKQKALNCISGQEWDEKGNLEIL